MKNNGVALKRHSFLPNSSPHDPTPKRGREGGRGRGERERERERKQTNTVAPETAIFLFTIPTGTDISSASCNSELQPSLQSTFETTAIPYPIHFNPQDGEST
jgi:hypothetical protein